MKGINKVPILDKCPVDTCPPSIHGGVEPYSKCPFSNHQSQQRIQILGYHISVVAVIRDNIFNTQNNEFFNWKQKS